MQKVYQKIRQVEKWLETASDEEIERSPILTYLTKDGWVHPIVVPRWALGTIVDNLFKLMVPYRYKMHKDAPVTFYGRYEGNGDFVAKFKRGE